jgi:hypothetical protein
MQVQVLRANFCALVAALPGVSRSDYMRVMRTRPSPCKPFSHGCFPPMMDVSSEIMEIEGISLW